MLAWQTLSLLKHFSSFLKASVIHTSLLKFLKFAMQLWLPCHMIHEITFGPSFEVAFISHVKLNHYLLNTKGGLLYCDSKIIRINSMLIVKIEREKEYGITRHHFADELYTKSLIKHDYLILLFYREECQRAWFESRNCYLNFPKICFHPNLIISHGFICLLCLYLSFQLVSSGDSLHELGMFLLGSEFHYKFIWWLNRNSHTDDATFIYDLLLDWSVHSIVVVFCWCLLSRGTTSFRMERLRLWFALWFA